MNGALHREHVNDEYSFLAALPLRRWVRHCPNSLQLRSLSRTRGRSPNSDDVISGSIASLDDKYEITVRDDRGFVDDVRLHQGTIINPTGLTL